MGASRRRALQMGLGAAVAAGTASRALADASGAIGGSSAPGPQGDSNAPGPQGPALIVSTWDFGAAANAAAYARLQNGGSLIDAVEAGAQVPEADASNHSVGLGGYPDRDGHVTLDAIIMHGDGRVGAVAALEGFVHAISVARRVMERTPHTFLVGEGARQFALEQGFAETDLLTPEAEKAWRDWLKTAKYEPVANIENMSADDLRGRPGHRGSALDHDTIGLMVCDANGQVAGSCTTSGMAYKLHGRVGDSPQAGCGLFVEGGVGAAASTGVGEEVTRTAGTARVINSMRMGMSAQDACREAVLHIAKLRGDAIRGDQVGFLAIDTRGRVGAYALLPGFTYAVTGHDGTTKIYPSQSLSVS